MATYTTTSAPLPWMEPYLQDFMGRAQEVANVPYQQSPTTAVGPNQTMQTAWQTTANRALQGNPVMGAANTLAMNTMNGQFLGAGNPYLSDVIANTSNDITNAYNNVNVPAWAKMNSSSGSFGNSGIAQAFGDDRKNLMQTIANNATQMRMRNYDTERGYQQSAMGFAPVSAAQDYTDANALMQVGQQQQMFDQGQADQAYKWWQEQQQYPQQQLAAYGSALGLGGGGTTTQTQPDPSTASSLLGGGLTGAMIYKMLFGG